MKTRLEKQELFPDKLPNSFLNRVDETIDYLSGENFQKTRMYKLKSK